MPTPIGNYLGWALSNQANQNPMQAYFEGAKAAGIPAEMQLRGAQAQQAINELEKERRMQTAMQGIDLTKPGGFEKAIDVTSKIDTGLALKLWTVKQNMDVESRRALSETMNNTTKYMGEALKTVITPQQYEMVRGNVAKMSPDIASGMPPVTELMTPDGKLDMNKFNLLTNRTQVINDTLAHNRALEMEALRSRLQAQRDAATDERQRRNFDHQLEMLDKRQAAQGLEQRKGDLDAIVDKVASGEIPPNMLSKRNTKGEYTYVLGQLAQKGTNLSKLQIKYDAAKNWAKTQTGQRLTTYFSLADAAMTTIERVKQLTDDMNLSGFRPMNFAEIKGLMTTAGNTPAGQLATAYVTQVNNLREEFANIANLGYAPTESVWHLARQQIDENYGVNQMHRSLDEVKKAIEFRVNAIKSTRPEGAPDIWGKRTSSEAGNVPAGLPPGSTLVPGYQPNGKPVYKTPDGKYLEQN